MSSGPTCCAQYTDLGTAIPECRIPGSWTVFRSRNPGIVRDQIPGFRDCNFPCWKARFTTKIQAIIINLFHPKTAQEQRKIYANAVVAELAGLEAALIPIESLNNGVPW